LWETDKLISFDQINPCHYIFHPDTETCTVVYSQYDEDYHKFYVSCTKDIEQAKATREYGLDMEHHPNWFDASYVSWISYDALHLELPDGYLYFQPIINWGKYREENGRMMMPVTVRMNHAIADGYLVSKVFLLLQEKIDALVGRLTSEQL
jgi:chloramphenicol O-acetyltransferase type A